MPKEFEFIEKIRHKYSLDKVGDDCAILPNNAKFDTVITTDMLIEDIDFRRSWGIPELLGQKALAVSLSDIAAMGGKPTWSMLSIGIPQVIWKTDFVDRFYDGYFKLANEFSVELVGGDVSKSPDKIVIDSIAAGEVRRGKAVTRYGAQFGDHIYTTGRLGGAAAGLKALEKNIKDFDLLKLRQLSPRPRIIAGQLLSKLATAMIDISDGLSSDLFHLCEASGVGAKLFANKIPVDEQIFAFTKDEAEQLDLALNGGEDFELLFTVKPKKILPAIFSDFYYLGEITANTGIIEFISDSEIGILDPKGYQHF